MKQPLIIIVIAVAVFAAACTPENLQPPQNNSPQQPNAGCASDSGCAVGGCSGQVCTTSARAQNLITTCEYRAEYDCYKLTSCGCVEGKCSWKENSEFRNCFDNAKSQPQQEMPQ